MNRIDFAAEDESKIAGVALWGQIVAVCLLAGALVGGPMLFVEIPGLGPIAAFAIQIALGISLFLAAKSFRRVARTDRDDRGGLLRGFRHLRRYFVIQGVLVIAALACMVVILAAQSATS